MKKIPGVKGFYSAKDIPGRNSFTTANPVFYFYSEYEPIFLSLDSEVQYFDQPIGMILASSMALANTAAKFVEVQYEKMNNAAKVIPSISHWLEEDKPRQFVDSKEYVLKANTPTMMEKVGETKKFTGELLLTCRAYTMLLKEFKRIAVVLTTCRRFRAAFTIPIYDGTTNNLLCATR